MEVRYGIFLLAKAPPNSPPPHSPLTLLGLAYLSTCTLPIHQFITAKELLPHHQPHDTPSPPTPISYTETTPKVRLTTLDTYLPRVLPDLFSPTASTSSRPFPVHRIAFAQPAENAPRKPFDSHSPLHAGRTSPRTQTAKVGRLYQRASRRRRRRFSHNGQLAG